MKPALSFKVITSFVIAGILITVFATCGVAEAGIAPLTVDKLQAGTEVPSACDQASFIADIAILDGIALEPGISFTKIWRLKNEGTCTWTTSYAVVFVGGDQLGAPSSINFPVEVAPGQEIDVAVPMIAPSEEGNYRGDWMLRNVSGEVFGLKEPQNISFWIEINIPYSITTATATQTPITINTATPGGIMTAEQDENRISTPLSPSDQNNTVSIDDEESSVEEMTTPYRFRAGDVLVPEITLNIPTPLDVSTDPDVIGTNLFLAAFMMLLFSIAAESFTRMLAANEKVNLRILRPIKWLLGFQKRITRRFFPHIHLDSRWRESSRLLVVISFYGLVFSLLDKTWDPFSLKGLVLFLSMAIAYGIVGLAGDLAQWRAIRKWNIAAELTVRPTNLLLAIASTGVTRIFSLVPGLMFGTPEALITDEQAFDQHQSHRLVKISAWTFTLIGLCTWIPTIITTLILRNAMPASVASLLRAFEAFLLVVFAVALENLFVQMLGFPGSFGKLLKRKNRWLWLGALMGVTFLFLHTLINPRAEFAEALRNSNVQVFLGIVTIFVLGVFFLQLALWLRRKRPAANPNQDNPG